MAGQSPALLTSPGHRPPVGPNRRPTRLSQTAPSTGIDDCSFVSELEGSEGTVWPLQDVRKVVFDPRGDELASETLDGVVGLASVGSSLAPRFRRRLHTGRINALVYAPAEPILASCGDDGKIVLSEGSTLRAIRTLAGRTLVSVGDDGRVVEWDVHTGMILRGTGLRDSAMPQVPGLRNDNPSAVDLLERTDDVRTLATLIAAAGTRPPLAIALLGEWGSGKSSLLLQVHDMVAGLATYSRALPGASLFAANVQQVQFNAWHYSDDQVWTGIVDHLFRALTDADTEVGGEGAAPDIAEVERAREELERRLSDKRRDLTSLVERSVTAGPTADLRSALRRGKAQILVGTVFAAFAAGGRVAVRWVLAHLGGTIDTARKGFEKGSVLVDEVAGLRGSLAAEVAQARSDVAALEDRLVQITAAARLAQVLRSQSDPGAYADARGIVGRVYDTLRQLDEALQALRIEQRAGVTGSAQPPLERIVLYIDDLDRCTPKRVVDVLAAVHLMLALPLFVVVVAIDALWLLNALESHYGSLLSGAEPGGGPRPVVSRSAEPTPSAAQVPAPLATTPPNLRPGGLLLRPAEADFMARLAPLVGTPRAGKKLANLYRLVRIRLPESELRGFIVDEDYRRVQILPAIMVGEPAAAPAVFASIRAAASDGLLLDAVRGGRVGASHVPDAAVSQDTVRGGVADRLAQILDSLQDDPVHVVGFQPWCALLERYSFHTLPG